MPIDYSKWNNIQVSSDEEEIQSKSVCNKKAVKAMVDVFWHAMDADSYPPEHMEKTFGIEMGSPNIAPFRLHGSNNLEEQTKNYLATMPLGKLMFCVWTDLRKQGMVKKKAMVEALLEGTLPQMFRNLCQTECKWSYSKYVAELVRRDEWDNISWDRRTHVRLSEK